MTDPPIAKILTAASPTVDLCDGVFDDHFVRSLPADPSTVNRPRQVRDACYSVVEPTPVRAPRLLAWSDEMGDLLGISRPATVTSPAVEVLAGNRLLPGMRPFATCYGGHQFGQWASQLGDGRAISLAEVVSRTGQRWELQLKGAGPTPYSRRADGRAVLRSSLREFLCSEAMHHLGIPTTRALSLVTTGEPVLRDMFYDGHPQDEPGAIVCRVAPSFVRLGNFELFASRSEVETLRRLADYVMATHFPELGPPSSEESYAAWFAEVCRRTAMLIAHWMRVGFVHGVMNTDNLSILGLTIDYGPYGWLEPYDPDWTPNTTDADGRRYCYANQPRIGLWNLSQFGHALRPLLKAAEGIEQGLMVYRTTFEHTYRELMAAKLGLGRLEDTDDEKLLADLLELLQLVETDWTIFFRQLAEVPIEAQSAADLLEPLQAAWYTPDALTPRHQAQMVGWLRRYLARVQRDSLEPVIRQARMRQANPRFILRNYLAQQAIDAAENGDSSLVELLLNVMRHPYDEQPQHDDLAGKRPEWARYKPGCSALSCSS